MEGNEVADAVMVDAPVMVAAPEVGAALHSSTPISLLDYDQ